MQTMEIEIWREHRKELLREAEEERLARRLRAKRPRLFFGGWRALLAFTSRQLPEGEEMAEC